MTSELRTPDRSAEPRTRDAVGAFEFDPHHCFACGELNEQGLRLVLHTDPTRAWAETTLEPRFQGWEAVVHGGIICTLLDEVMAWSVIGRGTWGVTARLNVAFRRPIQVGRTVRAEGWVVDQNRRAARTAGQVLDPVTGDVLATAEGTFMAVPDGQLAGLKARYGMRRVGPQGEAVGSIDATDHVDAPVRAEFARRGDVRAPTRDEALA